VSGSGKTSVLVHRARFLAKKYHQPVLLVTLTESMPKLLDRLADDLCGMERGLVITMTMSSLARHVVHELHPQSSGFYTLITSQQRETVISGISQHVREHGDLARTPLHTMDDEASLNFLRSEIAYVRGRLSSTELDQHLDSQSFQRRGRGLALNETARHILLDAIRLYENRLAAERLLDHEGIVAEALKLLDAEAREFNKPRCILCDEVQDLSELEIALLGRLPTPTGVRVADAENSLFLGRARDSGYPRPPARTRAGGITAHYVARHIMCVMWPPELCGVQRATLLP